MKLSYSDLFEEKSLKAQKIPSTLIEYMNKTLEENDQFEYKQDANGICILKPKSDEKLLISNISFELNQKQKNILGEKPKELDIFKYCNDFQDPIRTTSTTTIRINGNDIPINKAIVAPFFKADIEKGSFIIFPTPFPKMNPVNLINGKHEMQIQIERIANSEMNIQQYKGFDLNHMLEFTLQYNTLDGSNKLTVRYDFTKGKSFTEYLTCAYIFNGLLDGSTLLKEINKPIIKPCNSELKISEITLEIWNKITKIEEIINTQFDPTFDTELEDLDLVYKLYRSLVEREPYKINKKISSLSFNLLNSDIEENINRPLYFQFNNEITINLFGRTFEMYMISSAYNMMIYKLDTNSKDNQCTAYFKESDASIKPYLSCMIFKSEKNMNEFIEEKDIPKLFENAKLISYEGK